MRKSIINPETGDWARHEVAYSDAVAVEYPTHTRVFVSGMISNADGIEAQTRDVLSQIESRMADAGGDMDDVAEMARQLRLRGPGGSIGYQYDTRNRAIE